MAEEPTDAAIDQPLASVESDLFGSLIGFHGRIRMLIRDAERR